MDENLEPNVSPGGLFVNIKDDLGVAVYKKCKEYVNLHKKWASLVNRRIFLLRCRRNNVFPKHIVSNIKQIFSLELENHPYKNNVNKTLHNFRKSILKLEIKITIWKLNKLINSLPDMEHRLQQLLDSDSFRCLKVFSRRLFEKKINQIRENNLKKYEDLEFNQRTGITVTMSDKYVKNYTNIQVPKSVMAILGLGPKFGIPVRQDRAPKINLIKDVEHCISTCPLDETNKNHFRMKCVNAINNYFNSSRRHEYSFPDQKQLTKTSKFIKDNPNIIIGNADKGNTTVIMYYDEYMVEVNNMLNNSEFYLKLDEDPTKKIQDFINKSLKTFKDNASITPNDYKLLIRHNSSTPKLYCQRKVHKPNLCLRPIVSSINTPGYNIGRFLHIILSQVLSTSTVSVKNSHEVVEIIKNIVVPEDYILVSFDVVSLFTNIPKELVIKVVKKRWRYISNFTYLDEEVFVKLVEICFDSGYFAFDGAFFRQIFGTIMGNPASPSFAGIVVEDLLDFVISQIPFVIPLLKLYVDDTITLIPKNSCNFVLQLLNSYHTSIKFTMEVENQMCLPFLDINIINNNGRLLSNWYYKPTNSNRLLNYYSNHSISQRTNIAYNLIRKSLTLSDPGFHTENLKIVKRILSDNNYPAYFTNKIINRVVGQLNIVKDGSSVRLDVGINMIRYCRFPFIPDLSYKIQKIFNEYNCRCAFYNLNTTKKFFTPLKDPTPLSLQTEVVYKIPCGDCEKCYIGQTRQYVKERIKQHKSDLRNTRNVDKTALTNHAIKERHHFDFDNTTILDREKFTQKRNISEMLHIKLNNSVNFRDDVKNLSLVYDFLLDVT